MGKRNDLTARLDQLDELADDYERQGRHEAAAVLRDALAVIRGDEDGGD